MSRVLFMNDLGLTIEKVKQLLSESGCGRAPIWSGNPNIQEIVDDIDVMVTADHAVDASAIDPWGKLKMVSLAFTGYDRVDLAHCRSKEIAVYYVPGYSTDSVVELAIGLTLSLLRKIPLGDRYTRDGRWDTGGVQPGVELAGKTVGVIGLGTIGRRSAHRFLALGCRVIAWNRSPRPEMGALGIDVRTGPRWSLRSSISETLSRTKLDRSIHRRPP